MAGLDLTEAVEAAARALYEDAYPGATYTHADHERCLESDYAVWPSRARVVVAAVAPILAAQARREALEGLAERMRADAWKLGHLAAEAEDNDMDYTATQLAAKAEGIRVALGVIEEALR